jgi:hypothetical protein
MKIEIYKNFLEKEFFLSLKKLIIDQEFPWRFRPKMTDSDDKNGTFYFTFSFFNELKVNSDLYYPYIVPILKQLNCLAPIQVRANLNINKDNAKSAWHTDYNFLCKTAVLYINTCNGGTELQLDN